MPACLSIFEDATQSKATWAALLGWRDHAPARRARRRPIVIDGVNPRGVARARRRVMGKMGAIVVMWAGKSEGKAPPTVSPAHPVVRKGRRADATGAGTRDQKVAVVTAETRVVGRTVRTGVVAGGTCETPLVGIVNLKRENHSPRARRGARTSLRSSWRR